jgi:hypothetical protein
MKRTGGTWLIEDRSDEMVCLTFQFLIITAKSLNPNASQVIGF